MTFDAQLHQRGQVRQRRGGLIRAAEKGDLQEKGELAEYHRSGEQTSAPRATYETSTPMATELQISNARDSARRAASWTK